MFFYLIMVVACGVFWKKYLGFGFFYGACSALFLSPVIGFLAPFYIRVAADDNHDKKRVANTLTAVAVILTLFATLAAFPLGIFALVLIPLSFIFSYAALHVLIVPSIENRRKLFAPHDSFSHRF